MITVTPPRSSDAEIEAFLRTCETLGRFDGGISFDFVDGFLTALAAAPRQVPPERWLAVMCDDAFERAFADPIAHGQALATLQARLRVLLAQLDPEALLEDPEAPRLEPLIAEYTDEDRRRLVEEGMSEEDALVHQTGVWWAEGFFNAVGGLPEVWALPEGAEAEAAFEVAFQQIEALRTAPDEDGWKEHLAAYWPHGEPSRDDLIHEACMSVQDIRLFWVDFAPKTATRRVEATPGRNDPCPCGSGKKFKKCHGA